MQIVQSRDDEGVGRRVNLRAQLLAGEWSDGRNLDRTTKIKLAEEECGLQISLGIGVGVADEPVVCRGFDDWCKPEPR